MNQSQVTLYTEQGVLIFSKNPNDTREIPEFDKATLIDQWLEKGSPEQGEILKNLFNAGKNEQDQVQENKKKKKNLKGTLISILEPNSRVYYIQPGYVVSYENTTKKYYVLNFQW